MGATPVPLSAVTSGDPAALVTNEALAEAVPLDWGVKVMVKVAVWPDAIVSGSAGPARTNSALLTEADDTVTLPPVALRVAVMFLLEPTVTLPKPKLVGLTANVPTVTPVPESEMVGELEASEVNDTVPVELAPDCGVKLTLNVKLWFAISVSGKLRPLTAKPVPLALAWVTVTVAPPVLVIVAVLLLVLPTFTLPKLIVVGLSPSMPGATPVPVRLIVRLGLEPLLVIVTLPVGVPADCGANTTLNDLLAPAARVNGTVIPLTV